ncbi:MAG: hypothetical protein QM765_23095 [Myxococcales bacterium]
MASRTVTLQRLAQQHRHHVHEPASPTLWTEQRQAKPAIPASFEELRALASFAFGASHGPLRAVREDPPPLSPALAEAIRQAQECKCGTPLLDLFREGLRNPELTEDQLDQLDGEAASAHPPLKKNYKTANFSLFYNDTGDDILAQEKVSAELVKEVGGHLEAAYARYAEAFGRAPYPTKGIAGPIRVEFYWLIGVYGSTEPDGPIALDSNWFTQLPRARRSTATHELFHRLQYAFRAAVHFPTESWWSEGTAAWAGAWMSGGLIADFSWIQKMLGDKPESLYGLSYDAFPLWGFLQGQRSPTMPDEQEAVRPFLLRFADDGNAKAALISALQVAFPNWRGSVNPDWYVNLFYLNAIGKHWLLQGGSDCYHAGKPLYERLVDFHGKEAEVPSVPWLLSDSRLSRGGKFEKGDEVLQASARVFKFTFEHACNGVRWRARVKVPKAGPLFFLSAAAFRAGQCVWNKPASPVAVGEPSLDYLIDDAQYDSLFLVVSHHNRGGVDPGLFTLQLAVDA